MVIGLNSFKEWFQGYESCYALIGGTACDLLMDETGFEFRATKDIDMVLIAESLSEEFGLRFWEYIKAAGYRRRLNNIGKSIYYRFTSPKSAKYPAAIELFSRRIDRIILPPDANLTSIPIGDNISSLSAILLDDEYYEFLKSGLTVIDGVSILTATHMIPFKAKAWIDLSQRKASGEHVDSRDIRKHKNDIIKLSDLLLPNATVSLPGTIKNDMLKFLAEVDRPDKYARVAAAFEIL